MSDIYEKAVVFATRDKPSASYLSRRLGVTWGEANEMLKKMEGEGRVSAPNHAGMRKIITFHPNHIDDAAVRK